MFDIKAVHKSLWLSGNLAEWKLHSAQLDIYSQILLGIANNHKEFGFTIARQFGKSYMTIIMALELCIKNPGIIVRILGPTLTSIKDIVEDNLAPIIRDAPKGLINRAKSANRYNFSNGSSLRIGTMERAHIDQTARGGNAHIIFLEECAASVKSKDLKYAIQSVINPQLLRSSKKHNGGILVYITTPSPMLDHYYHTDVEPRLINKNCHWRRTVYDNPQLTQEQIKTAIERSGGEQSDSWRREYLCEVFRNESITIIPEFDANAHVKPITIPQYKKLQTVVDFGGSRDCTEAIVTFWDCDRQKLCITHEMFAKPQTPTAEMVENIKAIEAFDAFGPVRRVADMPGLISVDLNRTLQFTCEQTAKDDATSALQNVRNMFYRNEIEIDPRCIMLIKTLLNGRWNNNRTDFQRSEELGHCDAIDALIYACRNIDKIDPKPRSTVDRFGRINKNNGFEKLGKLW